MDTIDRDFELVFKAADDPSTALNYFGEPLYHHIIHFAPKSTSKKNNIKDAYKEDMY